MLVFTAGIADMLRNDPESADVRALLVKGDVPTSAAAVFLDDVVGVGGVAELTGDGYARQVLDNVALTVDDDELVGEADAADFGEIEAGETVLGVLVFRHVTNAGDSPVWAFNALASPTPTSGGDFEVQWPSGWVRFAPPA